MRFPFFALLFVLFSGFSQLILAAGNPYPYVEAKALLELKVESMADSAISTTLTNPSGSYAGLYPLKAQAVLISSTGALSYTSSSTSSVGFEVTAPHTEWLGIQQDGIVKSRHEFSSSRWTGDWLFRFWLR